MHFLWRYQSFCRFVFKRIRNYKNKHRASGDSENRRTERIPQKVFRCGSEDHLIAKYPKPPKEIERCQNQVYFNEIVNSAPQKECNNGKNNNNQNIFTSIARISDNEEGPSKNFSDS